MPELQLTDSQACSRTASESTCCIHATSTLLKVNSESLIKQLDIFRHTLSLIAKMLNEKISNTFVYMLRKKLQ